MLTAALCVKAAAELVVRSPWTFLTCVCGGEEEGGRQGGREGGG